MVRNGVVGLLMVVGVPALVAQALGIPLSTPLVTVALLQGVSVVFPRPFGVRALLLVGGSLLTEVLLRPPEGFAMLLVFPFVLLYTIPRLPVWAALVPVGVLSTWIAADHAFSPPFTFYFAFACLVYPHIYSRGCLALAWVITRLDVGREESARVWDQRQEKAGAIRHGLFLESIVVDGQGRVTGAVFPTGDVIDASSKPVGYALLCCPPSSDQTRQTGGNAWVRGVVLDNQDHLVGQVSPLGIVTDEDGRTIGYVDHGMPSTMLAGGAALLLLFSQRVGREALAPDISRALQPD